MFIDPLYIIMILPALLLAMWASWRVKANFKKYSQIRSGRGLTGAQAANELLNSAGISDVRIVRAQGVGLSDHYHPVKKQLALSEGVYDSPSIAAVGIAAHEAGHAIQHAEHYKPLWLRSLLVPTASVGSSLGYIVMLLGLFMASQNMVLVGAVLFSAVLIFQLVTLPLDQLCAGLRADAEPVNASWSGEGAIGLDRDLESLVMEGFNKRTVEL